MVITENLETLMFHRRPTAGSVGEIHTYMEWPNGGVATIALPFFSGEVLRLTTTPGTCQSTYVVQLLDMDSVDVLLGLATARSAADVEILLPRASGSTGVGEFSCAASGLNTLRCLGSASIEFGAGYQAWVTIHYM